MAHTGYRRYTGFPSPFQGEIQAIEIVWVINTHGVGSRAVAIPVRPNYENDTWAFAPEATTTVGWENLEPLHQPSATLPKVTDKDVELMVHSIFKAPYPKQPFANGAEKGGVISATWGAVRDTPFREYQYSIPWLCIANPIITPAGPLVLAVPGSMQRGVTPNGTSLVNRNGQRWHTSHLTALNLTRGKPIDNSPTQPRDAGDIQRQFWSMIREHPSADRE